MTMEIWALDIRGCCLATETLWGQTPGCPSFQQISTTCLRGLMLSPFKGYEIIYEEPEPVKETSHSSKMTLFPRNTYIYTRV